MLQLAGGEGGPTTAPPGVPAPYPGALVSRSIQRGHGNGVRTKDRPLQAASRQMASHKACKSKVFQNPRLDELKERCTAAADVPQAAGSTRDDYREFAQLVFAVVIGQVPDTFRRSGAVHHARRMAKALYAAKIVLLEEPVSTYAVSGESTARTRPVRVLCLCQSRVRVILR